MTTGNAKLMAFVGANLTLNGVTMFIQKALPIMSFFLIVLQIIAALYAVYHIFRKRKNEKIPDPPDI